MNTIIKEIVKDMEIERTIIRNSSINADHIEWDLIELEDRGFYNITVTPKYRYIAKESSCEFCDNRKNSSALIINLRTKEIRCKLCGQLQTQQYVSKYKPKK